jgi:putative resolvase
MEGTREVTISIGEAAHVIGVSTKTLRRWADADKIKYEWSPTGQR